MKKTGILLNSKNYKRILFCSLALAFKVKLVDLG